MSRTIEEIEADITQKMRECGEYRDKYFALYWEVGELELELEAKKEARDE